jgi:hypothetical protein
LLEQGHSEISRRQSATSRRVARAPAPARAAARWPPAPRLPGRARAFPRCAHVSPGRFAPLEASESAPPLAPRAGRRAPDGPPDGTAFPCRALLPRTPHAPRRHRGSLGSLAGTLFPYKMVAPFSSRPCPGPSRRRRHCWQPRWSSGPGWPRTQASSPPPSLAPTLARKPSPSHRRNPTSPAHRPQRQPPAPSAGRAANGLPTPIYGPKPVP